LTNEKKLSTKSIAIAISALRFLYRITLKRNWSFLIPALIMPKTLHIILSPEEVVQFLDCVKSRKHRTILTTSFAAGLRISEAVALTPPAIDSKRMVTRVELGKG
jgi:site-specific recombinase XerD